MQNMQLEFRSAAREILQALGRDDPTLDNASLKFTALPGESVGDALRRVRELGRMHGINIARAQKNSEWSYALTGASFAPRALAHDTIAQYEQRPPVRGVGNVAKSYIDRIHAEADELTSGWHPSLLNPKQSVPESAPQAL